MSSWLDVRYRSIDPLSARLSDLIQKQIDAETKDMEVTDEDTIEPIVPLESRMIMRDNLFRAKLRDVVTGQITFLPQDPDGKDMRLWLWNEHGGRYLTDHSFMNNICELLGTDQSKLINNTDDDGISGTRNVNRMINDQHIKVYDNSNVRIKEISATATGFTVLVRLYISFLANESLTGRRAVLFSKIDTEQVDFGYAAHLSESGTMYWFVKDNNRERFVTLPNAITGIHTINQADYAYTDFAPEDFYTAVGQAPPPCTYPYNDWAFQYEFSTKKLYIIKNGVKVAESGNIATDPRASGLVGWWKLQEGGDIGNTTTEPITYTRKVYNNVTTGNDGLITNATWSAVGLRTDEAYLRFDGNNDLVDVNNYTAIQNLSAFTVSFWYYRQATPTTDGYLVRKGTVLSANSWLVYYNSTGFCRFSLWNNSTTRFDITFNAAFPTTNWYHVVAKVTLGSTGKIFVNNVKVTGGGNVTGTLDTGATVFRIGGTTTANTPTGLIHDVMIWNRELSDAEVAAIYNQGHPHAGFPAWAGQPPPLPDIPEPITVPFTQIYDVPQPATKEYVRLHKIVASGFTARYTGVDGTTIAAVTAPFASAGYDQNTVPAGGGGTPETVCDISQSSSSHVELSSSENFRAGNQLAAGSGHIGKTVTTITPRGRKQGSPTGTMYGRVWSSAGALKATIGSYAVTSWSTTDGNQPALTGSATSILAAGDVVGIEFAGGDSSNNVDVDQNDSSPDSNWTGVTGTTGGWTTDDIGTGSIGMSVTATVGSSTEVKMFAGDDGTTSFGIYVPASGSVLNGKKITRITMKAMAVGAPTGNLKMMIFKSGTDIQIGATIAANTIATGSPGDLVFTDVNNGLDTGYALVVGDTVALDLTGGTTNSTNYIKVYTNTTSLVANVNERRWEDTTKPPTLGTSYAWVNYATNDPVMKLETGGYNLPQQDPWVDMNGTTVRAGNKIASASSPCVGKKITKVRFRCKRIGAASGTATCVIRDSTNAIVTTMGTKNVNDIGTSAFEDVDFQNLGNTRSAANGDRILLEYVGTAIDYIQVNFKKDATATGTGLYEIGTTYTTSYTDTNAWDMSGSFFEGGTPSDPLARTRVAIKIATTNSTIKAAKISKFKAVVRVQGTLPGDVVCRIRKAGTDTIAAEIGTIVANTIPLAGAISEQTFTKEPVATYAIQVGDYLTLEYNDGNDTNYLEVMNTPTDGFNSTNTHMSDWNDIAYANFTTKDVVGTIWKDGYTIIPTIEEQPPPRDEYYSHDLHLFSGGYNWSIDGPAMNPCNGIFTDIRFYRKLVTTAELLNVYLNRYDRKTIHRGEVSYLGFFWMPPFT